MLVGPLKVRRPEALQLKYNGGIKELDGLATLSVMFL